MKTTDKQVDGLQVKHVGSFLLLMLIAIIRPSAIFPQFTLSLEPVSVLLIGILLCYKIALTIGFVGFWRKYRIELLLLIIYFSISLISLYLNKHRYADIAEIIRYGVTFIVITASFPAALFLFMLPQNHRGFSLSNRKYSPYLPLALFLFLALLVLWQSFDFQSSKALVQYFVAAEIWPAETISGFFRVRTDAASVLGLALLSFVCAFFCIYMQGVTTKYKLFFIIISSLLLLAGLLTGGRVFILVLLVSALVAFIRITRKTPKNLILLLLVTILLFLVAPLILPFERVEDSSSFLAYMLPYRVGETIFWGDLIPNFSSSAFSDRVVLWQHAFALLDNNWLIGVSNGGFRLSYENVYQNSHTLLLQSLIAGGVLGLSILLLLAFKVAFSSRMNFIGVLVTLAVLVSLQVDYQLDHSVPWNIAVAYLLMFSIQQCKITNCVGLPVVNNRIMLPKISIGFIIKTVVGIGGVLLVVYFYRVSEKQNLPIGKRLDSFIVSRNNIDFTLVDEKLNYKINYESKTDLEKFVLVNIIDMVDSRACFYDYGQHRFIQVANTIDNRIEYSQFSQGDQTIGVYNTGDLNCGALEYPQFDTLLEHQWLSSNSHFIYRSDRHDWALWWRTRLSSSLFYAEPGTYNFSYEAKGSIAFSQWPVLRLSIKNRDGLVLKQTDVEINNRIQKQYRFEYEVEKSDLLYMELSYINDGRDLINDEDRNLWLFPQTFELTKQ